MRLTAGATTAEGNGENVSYLRIARKFFIESEFWLEERRRFSRAEAWLDLIRLVWFKEGLWLCGGVCYDVTRGQVTTTLTYIAERSRRSRSRVRRFLEQQRGERVVSYLCDKRRTATNRLNYDHYNLRRTSNGRRACRGRPFECLQGDVINKGKEGREGREEKKIYPKICRAWSSRYKIFPEHRRLTDGVRRAVSACLGDSALEQLVRAIPKYGYSDEPFWPEGHERRRGWSLDQTLSRGAGAADGKFQ